MNEFMTWDFLGTFAGAVAGVMAITQFTKTVGFVKKMPTQLWSYILAVVVLSLAQFFTTGFVVSTFVLNLFNAVVISFAANGGYEAVNKLTGKTTPTDGQLSINTKDPNKDTFTFDVKDLDSLYDKDTITLKVNKG